MVLVGFSGVFVFGHVGLLCRDFDKVSDGVDLSKAVWTLWPIQRSTERSFRSKSKIYGRKKSRTLRRVLS